MSEDIDVEALLVDAVGQIERQLERHVGGRTTTETETGQQSAIRRLQPC
ncbi:MAG: hypothetical protein ACOYOB_20400 [Myxococcota bacterium]